MIRAFYTAASGLVASTVKQDVIANNIANAQTPGFKRQGVVVHSFAQALNSELNAVTSEVSSLKTDYRPGYPEVSATTFTVGVESTEDAASGALAAAGKSGTLGKTAEIVENSNVKIIDEMVGMIANMRGYEANQKVVQSVDHTLDKLINEGGRV